MRKLFLSLVFLSVLLSIHANPGIKGIVIDQTTRKALDYAHVVLYDGDHIVEEAMTEANGSINWIKRSSRLLPTCFPREEPLSIS